MKCTDERLTIGSSRITICGGFQFIPQQDVIAGGFSFIGLAVVKKGLRLVQGCGEQQVTHPILLEKKVPFQVVLVRFKSPVPSD